MRPCQGQEAGFRPTRFVMSDNYHSLRLQSITKERYMWNPLHGKTVKNIGLKFVSKVIRVMFFLFGFSRHPAHSWDINLTMRRNIPYLQTTMFYCYFVNFKQADNDVLDNLQIFDHFPKIVRRPHKRFRTLCEGNWRFPNCRCDDFGIIH